MNNSTNKIIEMLQNQLQLRDEVIKSLKRENEVQSIVIKSLKIKYKTIILIYSVLLMISSGIEIYNLMFK